MLERAIFWLADVGYKLLSMINMEVALTVGRDVGISVGLGVVGAELGLLVVGFRWRGHD